jgi:DNA-binding XRE family transcriptional regulator
MSISTNIKLLREHFNITQDELAKIAGVSNKAVSTWESGRYEPRMGVIQKIADHFNIKKSNIIEDNGMNEIINPISEQTEPDRVALRKAFGGNHGVILVKNNPTDVDIEFLKRVDQLSPENKEKIDELVNLYLKSQNKHE